MSSRIPILEYAFDILLDIGELLCIFWMQRPENFRFPYPFRIRSRVDCLRVQNRDLNRRLPNTVRRERTETELVGLGPAGRVTFVTFYTFAIFLGKPQVEVPFIREHFSPEIELFAAAVAEKPEVQLIL